MYWPTGSASRLSLSTSSTPDDPYSLPVPSPAVTKLRNREMPRRSLSGGGSTAYGKDGEVLGMARSRDQTMFATITAEEVSVWSTRPKMVLTKVKRTVMSLRAMGANKAIEWRPDGQVVVVLTTASKILLYSISPLPNSATVYTLPKHLKASFTVGPGEGEPVEAIALKGAGELHVERGEVISCLAATPSHLVIAVSKPTSSVRSIPWPSTQGSKTASSSKVKLEDTKAPSVAALSSTDLYDIEWIEDPTSHLVSISHCRQLGLFILVTSDGRAYAARRRRRWQSSRGDTSSVSGDDDISGTESESEVETEEEEEEEEEEESRPSDGQEGQDDWDGVCFWPISGQPTASPSRTSMTRSEREVGSSGSIVRMSSPEPLDENHSFQPNGTPTESRKPEPVSNPACGVVAVNSSFNLVAVGLDNGTISVHVLGSPHVPLRQSHVLDLRKSLNTTASGLETGPVRSLSWTSDGHALAVAWANGFSVWSVYGRLQAWGVSDQACGSEGVSRTKTWEDAFMHAGRTTFWGPGNHELFILIPPPTEPKRRISDEQLFAIAFAKSAVTTLHSPDNTKHAFLQLDDRVMVYRGGDSPDMSVINPESDVWQHIKIPAHYISNNWPIRYACISDDARLIAVAGKRGFTHYNALSGRWKLFESEQQEQSFSVRGGMQWFGNVLIVAIESHGTYSLRVFSRDHPLAMAYCFDEHQLPHPVVLTSIYDNSLLVYTADNTLYHFLIHPLQDTVKLRLCGSIGFEGVVGNPNRVRGMSWLIPRSQQRFGDPADDLDFATVIFLIDGKLVLLRPKRAADQEVKYDLQILADHIEFYWTHLSGIGTLENSLWGWNGSKIRVWLDALTIDGTDFDEDGDVFEPVKENLAIELDFYPLSVLMDKGIIIGVNHETAYRSSLDFAIFRIITNTHLFIHHVIRFHLARGQMQEAVLFASHYESLVYFAHALEILLHAVLEDEADEADEAESRPVTPRFALSRLAPEAGVGSDIASGHPSTHGSTEAEGVLPLVVDFLDHFPDALQVVVGCARKTEVRRWGFLFDIVGPPRGLFEKSLERGLLKIAASYLLVLHNLDPLEQSSKDTIRLFKAAMAAQDWPLCKELLRFLFSLDHTGLILRTALHEAGALPPGYEAPPSPRMPPIRRVSSAPSGAGPSDSPRGFSSPPISRKVGPFSPNPAGEDSSPEFEAKDRPIIRPRSPSSPTLPGSPSGLGFGSLLAKVGMSVAPPGFDFQKHFNRSPEPPPAALPPEQL